MYKWLNIGETVDKLNVLEKKLNYGIYWDSLAIVTIVRLIPKAPCKPTLNFLNFLDRNDNKKVKRTEHIAQEKFLASEKWEQYSNSQLLTLMPVGQVYLPFIKSSLSKTTLSWNISLILAYLAIYYWTIPLNVGNLRQNTKELSELLFPVPTRI